MTGIPRLNPGMKGTQEMLDSIEKCPTIQCLVLTSSSAQAPEPPLKDESHGLMIMYNYHVAIIMVV